MYLAELEQHAEFDPEQQLQAVALEASMYCEAMLKCDSVAFVKWLCLSCARIPRVAIT